MRWDSPFVLAVAGTLAVHLALVTGGDALVVTHPRRTWVPAPHLELVEIEVPPVVKPLPPPPPAALPEPVAPVPAKPAPRARAIRAPSPPPTPEPPAPPAPDETPAPSGGEQVVHMDDIAPSATGVGVAVGRPATGRIGRGGSGGGTGSGSGDGSGDAPPKPVSVAGLKTEPKVKGDYAVFDVGKNYPAEARALGIEGDVIVRLIIDEHGKVRSRVLLRKLGHGLDELAMKRAAEIEFEPARDADDHPVPSVIVWIFHMNLPQ